MLHPDVVFPDSTRPKKVNHRFETGWGAYLYVLEGGHVEVNRIHIPTLGAAKITEEKELHVEANEDVELLVVEVLLV